MSTLEADGRREGGTKHCCKRADVLQRSEKLFCQNRDG